MNKMSAIAIITARGGSKRIPRKNIKDFLGKPIVAYSIMAAKNSGIFDEVMVSTDDMEIAEIAKSFGANVPFMRSHKTSNDYATTADVLSEVLKCYASNYLQYESMCCIYPTAPFITAEKLKTAYNILKDSGADSVMPVVQYSFPPQRAMVMKNGLLQYQYPQYRNSRSQDLEPIYHDAGQFYFYKVHDDLSFASNNFAPLIVSETEVQDIDNESDWMIAEKKYSLLKRSIDVSSLGKN